MFIPAMTQHYAMLRRNLLYTGIIEGSNGQSSARLPLDATATRPDRPTRRRCAYYRHKKRVPFASHQFCVRHQG